MSDRVWQAVQAAAVFAAIGLFFLRPDSREDRPLLIASPAALPLDGVLHDVIDTKLAAPNWPIQIAAASLVIMPRTSTCRALPVKSEVVYRQGPSALIQSH